ncbi:MAG TPA: hypothetical protein VF251_00425 [Pyrinomonadaceae bacterium]
MKCVGQGMSDIGHRLPRFGTDCYPDEYRMKAICNYETGPASNKIALLFSLSAVLLFHIACSSNENAHTTATTIVPPPPRQVLTEIPGNPYPVTTFSPCIEKPTTNECVGVDPTKPLLFFNLNGNTFHVGEPVQIFFSVHNAELRSNGGDFRIRYIIDDEDAKWVDVPREFALKGWVPGKHTIRFELVGPDGWPYRNGNQNIVTREITVEAK